MYRDPLGYKCIQCPQQQGILGLASGLHLPAAPGGGGCAKQADPAKLANTTMRPLNCSRCRNHGYLVAVQGHAGKCPWKQCNCEKCCLITEHRAIMAAQKQLKKQASEEDRKLPAASSLRPRPPLAASGDLEPGAEGPGAAYLLERPPRGPSPRACAFQPVLGGRGPMGANDPAALARPSSLRPQLRVEAAGQAGSGPLEPMPGPPPPPFASGKTPGPLPTSGAMGSAQGCGLPAPHVPGPG